MSVHAMLQAALVAAIEDGGVEVTGVFDAPPLRAAVPHALVEEVVLTDWSTKDMAGREGRVIVRLHDAGERPARLRVLTDAVQEAVAAMPVTLSGGWRIVSLAFLRSRILAEGGGKWRAVIEWRVRLLREH